MKASWPGGWVKSFHSCVSGLFPTPYAATYSASKAAVAYLTETLRIELQCWGINVSTIIPSGYRTGMLLVWSSERLCTDKTPA